MQKKYVFQIMKEKKNMGLKERRKKIMALMLAACVAGTSVVPVAASDVSVFSDGTDAAQKHLVLLMLVVLLKHLLKL